MTHRDCFLAYLARYAGRDLAGIAGLLAEDVSLRDWNLAVQGKAAVLAETAKNFAAARTIEIQPLNIMENTDSVAGELRILVDGAIELQVIDIVDFDAAGRIQAIRAYLGRPDSA